VAPGRGARPAIEVASAPVELRGAHHRAAAERTPIPVGPADAVVLVAFTVEAAPGSRLAIELRDESGRALATSERTLDDPGGLVILSVAAASLPRSEGEIAVRVAGVGQPFVYPFRVERTGG
jgi:hypothetical protein